MTNVIQNTIWFLVLILSLYIPPSAGQAVSSEAAITPFFEPVGSQTLAVGEDIGINRITFVAISAQDPSITATLEVDVTVLPAISSRSPLRIILPDVRPVRPGLVFAVYVR